MKIEQISAFLNLHPFWAFITLTDLRCVENGNRISVFTEKACGRRKRCLDISQQYTTLLTFSAYHITHTGQISLLPFTSCVYLHSSMGQMVVWNRNRRHQAQSKQF